MFLLCPKLTKSRLSRVPQLFITCVAMRLTPQPFSKYPVNSAVRLTRADAQPDGQGHAHMHQQRAALRPADTATECVTSSTPPTTPTTPQCMGICSASGAATNVPLLLLDVVGRIHEISAVCYRLAIQLPLPSDML